MQKVLIVCTVLALVFAAAGILYVTPEAAQGKVLGWQAPPGPSKGACTTIQSGQLVASDGSTIEVGFDQWGYNYQGHMFNGGYCDAYRDAAWCQEYADDNLIMKWNDAWLSNKDCDNDGLLDRHYGFDTYRDSGAWLTNHQSGEYEGDRGKTCRWNYFVKIIAAPAEAFAIDGVWYTEYGELGPVIWGDFAIIQQVENDTCDKEVHGLDYLSPDRAGLGNW